jgi:hypothetical protein
MLDIDVTFDARKVGGSENPISVSPSVCRVSPGARQQIRFNLQTVSARTPAGFDLTPAVFSPDSPVRFAEPVALGATSFSIIDHNENQGPLPHRLYCTLWVRYNGQSYPALYPTIVNEPFRPEVPPRPEEAPSVLLEAGAPEAGAAGVWN